MSVFANYDAALPKGPVALLPGFCRRLELGAQIVVKTELFGPTGHVYDRVAAGMLELAAERGELNAAGAVEASSGAFALSLAICAARRGVRLHLCVPDTLSEARRRLLAGLGAQLHPVAAALGRAAAEEAARSLAQHTGAYFINYLENDDNPEVHRRTTGPELLSCVPDLNFLVCGVASGGTISGTAEHVKAWTNGVQVAAVEPFESQVLSGGFAGRHGITGLGLPFVPGNYNPYIVDRVLPVKTGDAAAAADTAFFTDGLPCSAAGGAALAAAAQLAAVPENAGKVIAVVIPSRRNF